MKNILKDNVLTWVIIGLIIIVTPILVYASGYFNDNQDDFSYSKAIVLEVNEEVLQEDAIFTGRYIGYQQIKIEIIEGEYKGQRYNIRNTLSRIYNVKAEEGMTIITRLYEKDGQLKDLTVENYKRDNVILMLVILFFVVLIIFGGIKGVKSIISLIFTGIMIVFFMLPLVFKGYNITLISVITISITSIITLLLVSGYNKKTLAAIVGTVVGVVIAGIISCIAGEAAHLSGATESDVEDLIAIAERMTIRLDGLMFSGILIASLGAIMDVAMSISSAVFELKTVKRSMSFKALFQSSMNVGKDIMGTMSNTLILAFVGSSFNMIILLTAYNMPLNQLINSDMVVIECIQALAGSVGIILTVPITGLVASYLATKKSTVKKEKN